jgi:hypothetical protein
MMGGPATHDRERTKVGLSAGDLVPGSTSEYKRAKDRRNTLKHPRGPDQKPKHQECLGETSFSLGQPVPPAFFESNLGDFQGKRLTGRNLVFLA